MDDMYWSSCAKPTDVDFSKNALRATAWLDEGKDAENQAFQSPAKQQA